MITPDLLKIEKKISKCTFAILTYKKTGYKKEETEVESFYINSDLEVVNVRLSDVHLPDLFISIEEFDLTKNLYEDRDIIVEFKKTRKI